MSKQSVWCVMRTGNHQGLVVDEETGANIAVAYDKVNAPLLAAAPELLAALDQVWAASEDGGDMNDIDWRGIRDAVNKATAVNA